MDEELLEPTGEELETPDAGELDTGTQEPDALDNAGEEQPDAGASAEPDAEKVEVAFARRLSAATEKIRSEYEPYRALIESEAARYNMTPAQYLQAVREQQEQAAAQQMAAQYGLSEEVAKRMMAQEREINVLKQRDMMRESQSRNAMLKAELKDKPFFAELEPEIDRLISINPAVDAKTAYYFLRGSDRFDSLLEKARKDAEAKVMADIAAKRKGKVQPPAAANVTPKAKYGSLRDALTAAAAEIEF